jgi:hypothetical protein
MATADLKVFIEDSLRSLDPTIDLSPGAPAQIYFITPLLSRLGTDPFDTDIDAFITDRFRQEFPEIYAEDPGPVREFFVNPLILLLEPLKREIQGVKRNQSFADPSVLSTEDAEALAANFYAEPDTGGKAVGVVRIYYPNPTSTDIEITHRFYTESGQSFYPVTPTNITAEQMTFNVSGTSFFMDVPVIAENTGSEYNIDPDKIVGVDGLSGSIKVTNLRKFTGGSTQVDTTTFVANTRESLTERSLLCRRGASARIFQEFKSEVRSVQVVGADDAEMQRDILVADSPGHTWATGMVTVTGKLALVQASVIEGERLQSPAVGDELLLYIDYDQLPSLPDADRFVRLTIEEVITAPFPDLPPMSGPRYVSSMVRWSGTLPGGLPDVFLVEGGYSRKANIQVSSLPHVGAQNISVPSGDVHIRGCSDVYVRPQIQESSTTVLSNLMDEEPLIQGLNLETSVSNLVVTTDALNWDTQGVQYGDVLLIENGEDAGAHVVLFVDTTDLYLTADLTTVATGLRFQVVRKPKVNPFEPRVLKFPFASVLANDLHTDLGSNFFTLNSNDMLVYGAQVGDTFRIKSGVSAGDYTITGFDTVLGGRGILVDRNAGGTEQDLTYEVFTPLNALPRPLVRLKSLTLLDSSNQSTGVAIPPALPLGAYAPGGMSAAASLGRSQRASGFVLPQLAGSLWSLVGIDTDGDGPYSHGFESLEGVYKAITSDTATWTSELPFWLDARDGCSYFLSVCEDTDQINNTPPVDPVSGDVLRINTGPNAGGYLIDAVKKFRYKIDETPDRWAWIYFIKIHGTFPVDVFKYLMTFFQSYYPSGLTAITLPNGVGPERFIPFPSTFVDWYDGLGTSLRAAILSVLTTIPDPLYIPDASTLQTAIENMAAVSYEWGTPSRGKVRTYFRSPTLVQLNTAASENVTKYRFITTSGSEIYFRPDPRQYLKLEVVPARLTEDRDVSEFPRDLDASTADVAKFTDAETYGSMAGKGVLAGDVLSVYEERILNSDKLNRSALLTQAGSSTVRAPTGEGIFVDDMVGNLVFIEQGVDSGCYRIASRVDGHTVTLDRPLSVSTPTPFATGSVLEWGRSGGKDLISAYPGTDFVAAGVTTAQYVTIYGMDQAYQGSYKIKTVGYLSNEVLEIERSTPFSPTSDPGHDVGFFVVTDAPLTTPVTVDYGTVLYGAVPFRMYEAASTDYVIESVAYEETQPTAATIQLYLGDSVRDGIGQPYRIYRDDLRRVTPSEMAANREGALYYFDTECVSLECRPDANLVPSNFLDMVEGTYVSEGYRHLVSDSSFSYSTLEEGFLEMPATLLPEGSEDSLDNRLVIHGMPFQADYEYSSVVGAVQSFLSSPLDRVTSANLLARHFLPAYVSYDATYSGGSSTTVVAKDISTYIDSLTIETALDVSKLEESIIRRGGNPDTPTRALSVVHDWDRREWLEYSEDFIGGTHTAVPYNGSPRVTTFIPGPNVSGQTDPEPGERIYLTRR